MDDEVTAFYARHCASPGGVILARIVDDTDTDTAMGIFSTLEAAREWSDTWDDGCIAFFIPHVIDVPDYGNVPMDEQH